MPEALEQQRFSKATLPDNLQQMLPNICFVLPGCRDKRIYC